VVSLSDENLENAEFVEVVDTQQQKSNESGSSEQGLNRPDLRVVQPITSIDGKTLYRNVGGMWKNVSKNGNEFYTLMIGNLKLLVFPNTNK
jgi:hypothetical protein